MESWIYDNAILSRHEIYRKAKALLNDVSNRDYPRKDYFNPQVECLDMDHYEKCLHRATPSPTMDAVIGISDSQDGRKNHPRLLLVELRLRYKNPDNLSKSNIEQKVVYTRGLLGTSIPIEQRSVFVFSEDAAPQALHIFTNWKREGIFQVRFKVCTVKQFNESIHCDK